MKIFFSYLFYYLGDAISRTTMIWFDGFGYEVYSKLMLWSLELDTNNVLWKSPRKSKSKRKK